MAVLLVEGFLPITVLPAFGSSSAGVFCHEESKLSMIVLTVNLTQAKSHHGGRYVDFKMLPQNGAIYKQAYSAFSYLVTVGHIVGGAIPVMVVLGSIKTQAEKASKQNPSMASAWVPASRCQPALLEFLS